MKDSVHKAAHFTDADAWAAPEPHGRMEIADLYSRYFDMLFRYGCKITSDREVVKDSIQELFFRLWRQRDRLETPRTVRQYLLISLRRTILAQLQQCRKRQSRNHEIVSLLSEMQRSVEQRMIEIEEQGNGKARLQAALLKLSRREREVIYLRYYAGLSHEEVVEVMDIKVASLYNLISRAIGKLRSKLTTMAVLPLITVVLKGL